MGWGTTLSLPLEAVPLYSEDLHNSNFSAAGPLP